VLKEVRFRLTDGRPVMPVARLVYESATLESLHHTGFLGEVTSGVNVVTGSAPEVDGFVHAFARLRQPHHVLESRLLETGPRRAVWYSRWRRPDPGEGLSLEHVALDHLGPAAVVRHRVRPGEIHLRIATEQPDGLERCARAVEALLHERYVVRRTYAGDYRVDEEHPGTLPPGDVSLLRTALRLGYYATPRRATLAEVSRAMGRSKSTVSERLKLLEGRAVEAFVERGSARAWPPAASALPEEPEPVAASFGGK
jgi:hypothetical protein